ncbi:DUF6777 domain-containing protein [Nocardia sp. NBC_00511]|uniref:DUF6777 domain-containing protein n=1 Tax=Nocardia sp. NBC_00511 TaxID=2903591 RepID=UPI0030E49BFB
MTKESDESGADYSADARHADGVQIGDSATQYNLFYRTRDDNLRLTRLGLIVAIIVALLAASGAIAATVTLTTKSEALGPPEVLLEPGDQQGNNPFMPTAPPVYHPEGTQPVVDLPGIGSSAAAKPYSGDLPGLYTAPRNQTLPDRDAIITFYTDHPSEAATAATALGADSTLTWSHGKAITGPDLVEYLRELTPVLLRVDQRVTNYTLVEGKPTPHQSILQAGTAVLVDNHGVPRFRSLSGAPLTLPTALPHTPTFSGTPWPGFDAKRVAAVSPGAALIRITLIDNKTGNPFDRPVGTTGDRDLDHPDWPTTTTPTPTPTTPPTTTITTSQAPTTARSNSPEAPLDLSGVWVLSSSYTTVQGNSVSGTVKQTADGFAFHYEVGFGTGLSTVDCSLPNKFGETVSMTCVSGSTVDTTDYGYHLTDVGRLTRIPWGEHTKFRFDGTGATPEIGSLGKATFTLAPQ